MFWYELLKYKADDYVPTFLSNLYEMQVMK